jgi:hypothetical protein
MRYLAIICAFFLSGPISAATIGGSVTFTGGVYSSWNINFNSSMPNVQLNSATITLPSGYFWDTTAAAPGSLTWQAFAATGGTAASTGLNSVTPSTAAAQNGANSLTLGFSDFFAGETFSFDIDVDSTPPGGCSGLLAFLCVAAQALDASVVDGNEIAGTLISLTFSGQGYDPVVLTTTLTSWGGNFAGGSFEGTIVPEPSTFALLGSAAAGLWLLRRRKAS